MNAVIVEDDQIVANHLKNILQKHDIKVTGLADNVKDAEDLLSAGPDFYLLDIRLANDENGINLGIKLKQLKIPFIYITANNELEVIKRAIKTQPESYLSKPFNERDVVAAVELLKLKCEGNKSLNLIGYRGEEILPENEIIYCKADGVYTQIITETKTIIQRIVLKELEQRLSGSFLRVHRSFIINTNKITARNANAVFVSGKEIPVSRLYKDKLA